ncbi:MAG: FHA domain-containing protein [Woeseiaceae bacterium]|nr:FHA domain-containing protein [Woeseiaceae bacterium]
MLESPFVLQISGPGIEGILHYRLPFARRIVGRSNARGSDIKVFDDFAAPRHCAFDWDATMKCHKLTVLGVNGLHINEQLVSEDIEPMVLNNGDVIRIGETTLVYSKDNGEPVASVH